MDVQRTFLVPQPIETVFDYLADFTHTSEWDPGTIETVRTGGDGGIGTTYRNRSRFAGRTVELEYETVEHDRPTRVRFRGRNKQATATDTLGFAPGPDASQTEIGYLAEFDFGFPVNLLAPWVLRSRVEKLADEVVEQLTRTLRDLA